MADKGLISEWNEGTFKSIRLHEIQEVINTLKLKPLNFTDSKFNYELLYININNLYHEGYSKYSSEEKKEVDVYMETINEIIRHYPPTIKNTQEEISGSSSSYSVDGIRLERLLDLLRDFERLVKHYNDKHGLTTANRREGSLL